MKVEGLTIYHVKSHLQNYRTARYKPESVESSEGTSEKIVSTISETKSLDLKPNIGLSEALRMQMQVQKQLHEQLESRSNGQLHNPPPLMSHQIQFSNSHYVERQLRMERSAMNHLPRKSTGKTIR